MNLRELKAYFSKSLKAEYPSEEIQSFFYILTEHYLQLKRIDMALKPTTEISESSSQLFFEAISQLKEHQPIQYITGSTEFYGLPFRVNKHTLIPRPETEELVDWMVLDLQNASIKKDILDLGTGSGCIAISLQKNLTEARVDGLDVSEDALNIATSNAKINEANVSFYRYDILSEAPLEKVYDVFVSNPPYVRELEKKAMQKNVLEYEPETALFVSNEEPLVFYAAIARLAKKSLKDGGILYFEINEYLSKELEHLMIAEGFSEIVIKKDLFGKDRMLKCYWYE